MSDAEPPVVAYVSSYAYAAGPANDVRSQGVLSALSHLGFRVEVMSGAGETLPQGRAGRLRLRQRMRVLTMGSQVTAWLDSLPHRPQLVWLYGLDIRFSSRVLLWARRQRVPVVCEVVDWYQMRDLDGLAPKAVLGLTNWVAMPLARRHASGFVVASQTLATYFNRRSRHVQCVPAVIPDLPGADDLETWPLVIGYVGSPGRRDGPTLDNLRQVAETWTGRPLEIHVAGVAPPIPSWSTVDAVRVQFHGRIPRQEALALVARCDATVLQRRSDRRFAEAGFPSKVAESMMLGTPPLTNGTSDIQSYLQDGRDAILLDDHSANALRRGMERLAATPLDRATVRASAQAVFSVEAAERRLHALLRAGGLA